MVSGHSVSAAHEEIITPLAMDPPAQTGSTDVRLRHSRRMHLIR